MTRVEEESPWNDNEPASELLARAVRSGDQTEVLLLWKEWVQVKSRILFYSNRDLFRGMTEEDVFCHVQERFLYRLSNLGYADCGTEADILARVRAFLFYSLKETKTDAIRHKGMEVSLGDRDPVAVEEQEDSLEERMILIYLRECIEELPSDGQRELAKLMLADRELSEIAREWGKTRQTVWNMFQRVRQNLRRCIETKRGSL